MKLLSLKLTNFRGIKSFTFKPDGKSASVYGKWGLGKTTLSLAEAWILTDRDIAAKAPYVKTIDGETSQEVHGLEHQVEGTYLLEGEEIVLTKTLSESLQKIRGKAVKRITGNSVDYKINGVPTTATKFKKFLRSIADEEMFMIITNPLYFGMLMPDKPKNPAWRRRMDYVYQVCGNIPDKIVISSSPKLVTLKDILGKKSIEDQKAILEAERASINKELDGYETRFNEASHGMPDITGIDKEAEQSGVDAIGKQKEKLAEERAKVNAGSQATELDRQLTEKETLRQRIAKKNSVPLRMKPYSLPKIFL
jgi:hypothetical protein